MPITDYTDVSNTPLILGQMGNVEPKELRTALNDSAVVIPFGFGIVYKASGNPVRVELPVDANSVFLGVAQYVPQFESRASYSLNADSRYGVPLDETFAYVVKGIVAVLVETAVTEGSTAVHLRTTSGVTGDERSGIFRASQDSTDTLSVSNARWMSSVTTASAASPQLALLSLNLA